MEPGFSSTKVKSTVRMRLTEGVGCKYRWLDAAGNGEQLWWWNVFDGSKAHLVAGAGWERAESLGWCGGVGSGMGGYGCVRGGEFPCLLLPYAPPSHVAVVMSCQRGLAEGLKLHNHALKPVGCHAFPPLCLSLFSLVLSPQLLISSCWYSSRSNHCFLSFHLLIYSSLCQMEHPSGIILRVDGFIKGDFILWWFINVINNNNSTWQLEERKLIWGS